MSGDFRGASKLEIRGAFCLDDQASLLTMNKNESLIMKISDPHASITPGDGGPPGAIPWYWSAFQEEYLDLYVHRNLTEAARLVELLADVLKLRPHHRVMDLCCGPGRHLVFLARMVREVIGIDLSYVLLRRARTHWLSTLEAHNASLATPDKRKAMFVKATMSRLPLAEGTCDRIVNLFTSFGYYHDDAKNQHVLDEIARVLRSPSEKRKGGMFAIDHINQPSLLANLEPETVREIRGRRVVEERSWNAEEGRVEKRVISQDSNGETRQWHESVRVYTPEELEAMLNKAGMRVVKRFGDYDGGALTAQSPRLILIARKREAA